jgi:hypothetical protein
MDAPETLSPDGDERLYMENPLPALVSRKDTD